MAKYIDILPVSDFEPRGLIRAKQIPDFPAYFVTRDGRVWSTHRNRFMTECWHHQDDRAGSYRVVNLSNGVDENGKRISKSCFVHLLVADAYLPKVEGKDCVNHKNCNKLINHVDNLERCTKAENNKHYWTMKKLGKWDLRYQTHTLLWEVEAA